MHVNQKSKWVKQAQMYILWVSGCMQIGLNARKSKVKMNQNSSKWPLVDAGFMSFRAISTWIQGVEACIHPNTEDRGPYPFEYRGSRPVSTWIQRIDTKIQDIVPYTDVWGGPIWQFTCRQLVLKCYFASSSLSHLVVKSMFLGSSLYSFITKIDVSG